MGYPIPGDGAGGQTPVPLDYTSGPKPRTVSVKAAAASSQLFTGVGYLIAASAGETTHGAPALAYIHDGVDATGVIVGVLACISGGPANVEPAPPGIYFQQGLWLEVASGTISVSVTFAALVDQAPN